KLRLNDMATIEFTYDVQHPGALIPPMLLVTFVENAFKYGISSCEPCFVRIHIEQKDNRISFESENSVFVREGKPTNKMGIDNCRKRLALLYPDGRHRLDISQGADNIFRVRLLIENKT
ncbi:MAG: sensor histidine kinase, partial [Prevotella sp.]